MTFCKEKSILRSTAADFETVPIMCPSRSNFSKWFQTKPKVKLKSVLESTCCNFRFFSFYKNATENPRVGSSILSLGTIKGKSATSGRAGGMRKAPRRGLLCRRSLICIKNFFSFLIFLINTYDCTISKYNLSVLCVLNVLKTP